MNELIQWKPGNELRQVQRLMDRLFWPSIAREDVDLPSFDEALAVDIFEKDGNVVVKAALPGVSKDDINVNVTDGILSIRAETEAEENVDEKNYHRKEYRYGKYYRSFRLPNNLDTSKVAATYKDGMLRLTFPRTETAKANTISVKVT